MFSHANPADIFLQIVVLLFAICVHESAHAWMANRLGDPTAKMLGRVSLNPLVHIDPFGTIIMPLILIVLGFPPFGWAKPTPVDPRNFKDKVRDDILTAVAGPVSNFITAFVAIIALAFVVYHTITWFQVTPNALPNRVRGHPIPPSLILGSQYAGLVVVTGLIALAVLR